MAKSFIKQPSSKESNTASNRIHKPKFNFFAEHIGIYWNLFTNINTKNKQLDHTEEKPNITPNFAKPSSQIIPSS